MATTQLLHPLGPAGNWNSAPAQLWGFPEQSTAEMGQTDTAARGRAGGTGAFIARINPAFVSQLCYQYNNSDFPRRIYLSNCTLIKPSRLLWAHSRVWHSWLSDQSWHRAPQPGHQASQSSVPVKLRNSMLKDLNSFFSCLFYRYTGSDCSSWKKTLRLRTKSKISVTLHFLQQNKVHF